MEGLQIKNNSQTPRMSSTIVYDMYCQVNMNLYSSSLAFGGVDWKVWHSCRDEI